MAKRVKTETVVLIAVLTAVAAGGIVAGLASATNGFDRDIIDEWLTAKEDYVKVDLKNNYDGKVLTVETAFEQLNYGSKVFDEVSVAASVSMDNGGLIISEGGQLTASFKINDGYNRVRLNCGANYVEIFENEDGKVEQDIFGNDIIQSVESADVKFTVEGHDPITCEGAEGKKYPETSTYTFSYDEQVTDLSITVSEGELRITSIELWNIPVEDTEETKDAE